VGCPENRPPVAGRPPRPSKPVNLTAAAERMTWSEACNLIDVSGPSDTVALEIRGLSHAENGQQNDGSRELVYVVIAGFGVLRCDGVEMTCTAGDVVFVPRECPHHFERLDGEIKIWRISPTSP
jgi:mannose-6-phosphate isomerase-like protein (cupin superfamily)